jgi:hypothetical protein
MKNPIDAGTLIVIDTQGSGATGTCSLNIIAAGPLSKQPGSTAYRIVLIAYEDGEYSVHHQMFNDVTNLKRSSLAHGSYFKAGPEGLTKATVKFAEKVTAHAEYLASLFREETVAVA